ncbi:MAG: metallophosphoesterase, partial [Verrucomicrobiae bacterium]|nr:metallophosphoesterase [Verrucomicrobiae bacterium]
TNAFGSKWAGTTAKLCPPLVRNELPVVWPNRVTLRGSVLSTGGPPTSLTVYWGRTDGGTNDAAWENATVLGASIGGMLSADVTNLPANIVVFYRVQGSNIAGVAWAPESGRFSTCAESVWGDITFVVASDLHYGATGHFPTADETCRQTIENMNALPGQPYPTHLGGGYVGMLRGALLAGDLTEWGNSQQWTAFTNDWGLMGERLFRFPVYEGFGNHDAGAVYGIVPEAIKARNQKRPGIRNISTNGYHYSFDWDFLHVVCLNVFPGNELDPGYSPPDPAASLKFLESDLASYVGDSGRPVVIFHHYSLDSTGRSSWSERQRTNYFNVISNYNVICIFGGHSHGVGFPTWRGITTCSVGTAGKFDGNFILARVTRTNLVLVERTRMNTWGSYFSKPISVPSNLAIANDEGASDITPSSARLNGRFLMNGPPPVHIYVCWGRTNAGTDASAWEQVLNLGALPLGPFSVVVTNLAEATIYHYRCFASNETQVVWAPSAARFKTRGGSANTPPVFNPTPDVTVLPGELVSVTNVATDTHSPPEMLSFTLISGPPGSSILTPRDGTCVFMWRPNVSHIHTTNLVAIVVSDEDIPPLYATQRFNITVLAPIQPIIVEPRIVAGQPTMKIWSQTSGTFYIEVSTNLTEWVTLLSASGPLLPFIFADTNWMISPVRFYRVRYGP